MGIFLGKIKEALEGSDQELRTLNLVKILWVEPAFVEDPQNTTELINTLRRIFYNEEKESSQMAILAKLHMAKAFNEFLMESTSRQVCLDTLRMNHVKPQAAIKVLLALSTVGKNQDLLLCTSYLQHQEPRVRLAALEVFSNKAVLEDLIHMTPALQDSNPNVKYLAQQILRSFSQPQVLKIFQTMSVSPHAEMRTKAALALKGLGKMPLVCQRLLELTHDPILETRLIAISALENHPEDVVLNRLTELTNDLSIEVCESAAKVLNSIKKASMDGRNAC